MEKTAKMSLSQKEEVRKDEIVAAAARVFFEKGFSRTSMDDVIAVTKGSKRTLYKYFPSKEDLFFAVILSVSDKAMAGLQLKHEADLRQTLVSFGNNYLQTLVSSEGLSLFRAVIAEAPHLPQLGTAFLENAPRRISHLLADYLKKQAGLSEVTKPDIAAAQFLALVRSDLHFSALLSGTMPSRKQIRDTVENAVETFLNGRTASSRTV